MVTFQGGDRFAKTMRALHFEDQRAAKLAMLKKAAEPIRERMEELVKIGEIAPHIVDRMIVQPIRSIDDPDFGSVEVGESDAAVAVGPSKDFFYGGMLEFGTAPHGKHPGTPAQPFARPAFDERADAAFRSLQDDIWAQIRDSAARSFTGRGV